MSQGWFEQKFGSTLNIQGKSGLPTSAVTNSTGRMNMDIAITPLWNAAQISSYLQTHPIVVVPVAPIPALDSIDCGYGLIFFRDSLQQINARLQVYVSSSRNLNQPDNVSSFTGFYWQINMDGSIEKILWLKNGRITGAFKPSDGRLIATSRDCDDDDTGSDCPSAAGGRRRNVIRVVLDATGGGIASGATWVWNWINSWNGGGSGGTGGSGGLLGLGFGQGGDDPLPTNSGSSAFTFDSEIDNTLFDLTGGTEKIRYFQDLYMLQMGFADTEFEDLYYNKKLFTSIEVYFRAVGRSAVTAAVIKNNMSTLLADAGAFGAYLRAFAAFPDFYSANAALNFPMSIFTAFAKYYKAGFTAEEFVGLSTAGCLNSSDPFLSYVITKWWFSKTSIQREQFKQGFSDRAGENYDGFVGTVNFYKKFATSLATKGRFCFGGNCGNDLPRIPYLDSDIFSSFLDQYKDMIRDAKNGDNHAQGQLMFEAAMLFVPFDEISLTTRVSSHVFRGTSIGYQGSRQMIAAGVTSVAIDPLAATVFAIESSNFGTGVLHIVPVSTLESSGVKIMEGNWLKEVEREVTLSILPTQTANFYLTYKGKTDSYGYGFQSPKPNNKKRNNRNSATASKNDRSTNPRIYKKIKVKLNYSHETLLFKNLLCFIRIRI